MEQLSNEAGDSNPAGLLSKLLSLGGTLEAQDSRGGNVLITYLALIASSDITTMTSYNNNNKKRPLDVIVEKAPHLMNQEDVFFYHERSFFFVSGVPPAYGST